MATEEEQFAEYRKRYKLQASPKNFLSGDLDKRAVRLTLTGKKSDDLNGAVKRRLLSELNQYLWEHPKDVDDTRLVFEAAEKEAKYLEKKDGTVRLVLKLEIGLASYKPGNCGC